MMLVAALVDAETASHAAVALTRHARDLRGRAPVPPEILELAELFLAAYRRQGPSGAVTVEGITAHLQGGDVMVPIALTYRQAADLLSVSESTVERLVRRGELATVALGPSTRRIPREAVEALVAERRTPLRGRLETKETA